MAWEIFNGKPVIIDAQTMDVFENVEALAADKNGRSLFLNKVSINRLDDVDINYDYLLRWSKNRSK